MEGTQKKKRISGRTIVVILIVLILLVAVAEYAINSGHSGTTEVDITVVETDPVNQLDHFFPDNVTLTEGHSYQLAVLNGDDDVRVFTATEFGINETLNPGEAVRVNFTPNATGTFTFYSPVTPCLNNDICHGKPGPYLSGTFTVTQ